MRSHLSSLARKSGRASSSQRNFTRWKVGIDFQPGQLMDNIFIPCRYQLLAEVVPAAALPDNGVVQGLTSFAVKKHKGLTLIGDTDRQQITPLIRVTL